MQDRTGLTVFLVRVVFVLFETRRFCKVARFVFPDLYNCQDFGAKVVYFFWMYDMMRRIKCICKQSVMVFDRHALYSLPLKVVVRENC